MVKSLLSLFAGVLMLGSLASCMEDPVTSEEAVAQNIFRPNSIGFRFINYVENSPTGSIRVYWSNSSSDAQKNFGGYVARILTFDSVQKNGTWIQQATVFAQKIVPKTVQDVVFDDVPVNKEYVFAVWGMRNPDPLKPDSLILSRDSVASYTNPQTNKRITFDPRPLENPTNIRAASLNATTVLLQWDKPSTHTQGNILSYTVYYRDPSKLTDSSKVAGSSVWTDSLSSMKVNPPGAIVGQGISVVKEYEYWVKAVRTDSTQFSSDTMLIRWSGGESIRLGDSASTNGLHLGQGLFFGNLNGRYSAKEVSPTDPSANLKIEDAGENVIVTGLNGTRFYATYHGASSLDVAKFSAPLQDPDYSEGTVTLPKATPQGGWIIYLKLFGRNQEVARILLQGSGASLVTAGNTINVNLILQPLGEGSKVLPYF